MGGKARTPNGDAVQAPEMRASVHVTVAPKQGYSIEAWMRLHDEKDMTRTVEYIAETEEGLHLVEVTYEARGADLSDLMRPYRNSKEWRRMADVQKHGPTTMVKL